MNIEKFLSFVMSHNATIIEVLIGLTLLAILFLSIRMFLGESDSGNVSVVSAGASLDMEKLETTLKEILEKAGQVPAAASSGSSEDSQRLTFEITQLKTDLQVKQRQIEELKSAPPSPSGDGGAAAVPGMSLDDKRQLESQIKELQAKLSEYEIISEDIADLSFYKEQNAKLQKELEALKSNPVAAAQAAPVAAPVETAPASAPTSMPEPEIVGRSSASNEPQPSEVSVDLGVDDQLMAEFAAAVEKQNAASGKVEASTSTPAAEATAESGVDLGQMDMDKMLAEAAGIKSDVPDVDPEKALGVSVDENKLLQEAAALEGVTTEEKQLMGEFENFVKKNES